MNVIETKILKNTYYNSINKIIRFITTLLLAIMVARLLGPSKFGTFTLVSFTLIVASLLSNLGLGMAATKYVSEFSGKEKKEVRTAIVKYLLKIKLVSTLFVVILLVSSAKFFAAFYSEQKLLGYLILSAISLLPGALTDIYVSAIAGLQKFEYLAKGAIVISPIKIILSLYVLKMGYGINGVIIVSILVNVIEFVYYYSLIISNSEFVFKKAPPLERRIKEKIFSYNWQIAILLFTDAIVWQRSEVFFLAKFHDASEVAFYSVGYGLVEKGLTFIPSIFTSTLMPAMSELYGRKDQESLKKIFIKSTRLISLLVLPLCFILMALSENLIPMMFGREYMPAANIFKILLISGSLKVILSPASGVCYGTENQNFMLKVGILLAVINLVLDFSLIPKFGAIGGAFANTLTQVIGVGLGVTFVCNILSAKFPFKNILKILFASFFVIPIIKGLLAIKSNFFMLFFSSLVAVFGYLIILIIIKAIKNDELVLLEMLSKKFPERIQHFMIELINKLRRHIDGQKKW